MVRAGSQPHPASFAAGPQMSGMPLAAVARQEVEQPARAGVVGRVEDLPVPARGPDQARPLQLLEVERQGRGGHAEPGRHLAGRHPAPAPAGPGGGTPPAGSRGRGRRAPRGLASVPCFDNTRNEQPAQAGRARKGCVMRDRDEGGPPTRERHGDGSGGGGARRALSDLPVAVIGAGPVGLAAAAHLLARGLEPVVLEAGETVGAAVRGWGHVADVLALALQPRPGGGGAAGAARLGAAGRRGLPDRPRAGRALPRPARRHARDGAPAAAGGARDRRSPASAPARCGPPGASCCRSRCAPLDRAGREGWLHARAVIDASGTWTSPSPAGASGLPARGERAAADRIRYGMPDVLGAERARYAGRRVLVLGGGDSATGVLLDLAELAVQEPATRVTWARRGGDLGRSFGGGAADQLPQRGALGTRLRALVERGAFRVVAPFATDEIRRGIDGSLQVAGEGRGGRLTDRGRRAGGGGRAAARPDLPLGAAARPRPGAGVPAGARAADRPERPLLRHGAAARRGRAGAAGARPVRRRDEELRPCADLPARRPGTSRSARSRPTSPATRRRRAGSSWSCPRRACAAAPAPGWPTPRGAAAARPWPGRRRAAPRTRRRRPRAARVAGAGRPSASSVGGSRRAAAAPRDRPGGALPDRRRGVRARGAASSSPSWA